MQLETAQRLVSGAQTAVAELSTLIDSALVTKVLPACRMQMSLTSMRSLLPWGMRACFMLQKMQLVLMYCCMLESLFQIGSQLHNCKI